MNKFKKIILNNNIPLYLCIDPTMKNVFVSYNVLYGSSGEWFKFKNGKKTYKVGSGQAHYLEHILGEHSKFGNIYTGFEKRMQESNAYTGEYVTSYHFKGRHEIKKSLEELIISVDEPVFDRNDVEASRHAIMEEAASNCNNPNVSVLNLVERNLYGGFEKYDKSLSSIGNKKSTEEITIDDLYNCYNAFYTDDNKFLVIAGNVDEKEIVDFLNELYSKRSIRVSQLKIPKIDYSKIRRKNEVIYRDVEVPINSLGVKVKRPDNLTMKQFDFCMEIIHTNLYYSRFLNELGDMELYDAIEYNYINNTGDYINYVQSFTGNNKKVYCDEIIEKLSKKDITPSEYELTKKSIIADEIRNMDNKYEFIKYFPQKIYYTENYTDFDYFKSVSYDEFISMIEPLDFSQYTVGEVRKYKKK